MTGLRSYATHMGAGAIGALIAVLASALLGALPFTAQRPAVDASLREMQQKVSALQKSIVDQATTPLPPAVNQRLEAIETGLGQLDDMNRMLAALREAQGKLDEQTKGLQGATDSVARLGAVEEQLKALSAAADADPQSAARVGQAAQTAARMRELETSLATRFDTLRKNLSQEMQERVAGSAAASEAAKSAAQRVETEIARVAQRLEALKTDFDARLANAAKTADVTSAVAPVAGRIAAIESNLQGLERAEESRKANAQRIVFSLELSNLKRAMDRGGSYAAQLAAVRKIAGPGVDLGVLERYQHDGVPTAADLGREFRGIANAIIDADAEQPDATLVDRLLSGARTIVRVRKVTHAPDDASTEAIVGRIQTALSENRLEDALAEAKRLPPKAAIPAQRWIEKLEARQAVDAMLVRLDGELKASLAGGVTGQKGAQQ